MTATECQSSGFVCEVHTKVKRDNSSTNYYLHVTTLVRDINYGYFISPGPLVTTQHLESLLQTRSIHIPKNQRAGKTHIPKKLRAGKTPKDPISPKTFFPKTGFRKNPFHACK